MSKTIFVNLPVADLAKSTAFYEALGATKHSLFSDATASCMVFSDTINVMLLTHEKFMHFSPLPVADVRRNVQALLCLSSDSKADVDATTQAAGRSGGSADPTPPDDYGFMYGRSFADPDGHLWQVMWIDMKAAQEAIPAMQAAAARGEIPGGPAART